nr:hypothetical protein [Tanacetum cinerariifolium]
HESSSSESSDGTSGTPGLEPVPSPVPKLLCWEISVGLTRVIALKGCFPLAEADSRGVDSAMVVGVGVGGVGNSSHCFSSDFCAPPDTQSPPR